MPNPVPTPKSINPEEEPEDIFEFVEKTPEKPVEVKIEKVREALEQHGERFEPKAAQQTETRELPAQAPVSSQPTMPLPIAEEEKRVQEVEQILADGLQDLYMSLPPVEQQKFKIEGEKAAREVVGLLGQVKVKIDLIISVIRRWLSIIPGVNKFFIEQESKIKAQKLLLLKQRK
ncbi:MAG: hypothetical protein WCT08_00630 [Patescibacteria group bacterium]|jgi:hypothetical protein